MIFKGTYTSGDRCVFELNDRREFDEKVARTHRRSLYNFRYLNGPGKKRVTFIHIFWKTILLGKYNHAKVLSEDS